MSKPRSTWNRRCRSLDYSALICLLMSLAFGLAFGWVATR